MLRSMSLVLSLSNELVTNLLADRALVKVAVTWIKFFNHSLNYGHGNVSKNRMDENDDIKSFKH